MNRRRARDVFDVHRFIRDVESYRITQRISKRELLAAADIDISTGLGILRGVNSLTLLSAVAFADVCDLSLDKYRSLGPNSGPAQ